MTATARLDLRMDTKDRDRIAHAAMLLGVPLATFVRQAALREAAAVATEAGAVSTLATDQPSKPDQHPQQVRDSVHNSAPTGETAAPTVSERLRGRATTRLSTDEIMRLTRGA